MALSRYGGIDGSQRISQNYDEINKAFKNVETEADSNKGIVDQHINNSDIHVTKAKQDDWDSKAPGIVKEQLDSHVSNHSLHVSGEERTKLSTIEVGAEPNQNAFSRVNGMAATSKTDEFKIVGDVGIEVTQNPNDKSIHLTATGTAAPGKHASTHLTGGTDPIPTATETTSGLMAPADKQALNTLKKAIDRVDLTTTLGPGTSVINADQASDLDLTVYGATLTNLLGSDGNFETDSNGDGVADGWTKSNNGTYSLETSNVKYGTRAQRISTVPSDTDIYARRIDHSVSFLAGKKYVFVADSLTDGTALASLRADYQASTITSSADSASSKTHFIKFTPTVDYSGFVRLYNRSALGNTGWVQWDGAGVYEVPEALYNRIGVDITEDNIRDFLPHVDGKQHVNGVIVTKQGQNLLPSEPYPYMDGSQTSAKDNAWINGRLAVYNGSSNVHGRGVWVDVVPGQTYTFSAMVELASNGKGVNVFVGYSDNTKELVNRGQGVPGLMTFTFTPTQPRVIIKFTIAGASQIDDPVYFSNIMLNLGTNAAPYEPADPQRLILPVTLASTPDGSVRDTAYYRDGAWRLMKRVDTSVDPAVALATPVESVISKAEGAITLHPGGNQITVETGVIQREKVTFDSGTKRATTSKRSARIIGVYKGTDIEPFTTYTSGSQTLPQLVNAVDSAASYYVTYITLDKYAYTANVTQVDAKYTAGLSGSVSGALRDVARLQTQNDRQDFADDYIEAKVDNLRVDVAAQLADVVEQTSREVFNQPGSFPKFTKYANNPLVLGNAQTQNQAGFATVICTDGVISNPIDKFYMYWAGHDGGGIWLSTAPHPLGPWTTYGQVITDASMYSNQVEYDSTPGAHISSPEVIFIPELNVLRMYFHRAYQGQFTEYCHSTDGLTWTKQPGRITTPTLDGTWTENELSYFRVCRVNEVFYATYQGRDRRPNVKGLGFGISNDGVNFRWSEMPLFYNTQFKDGYTPHADLGGAPCLINIKGQLWVFFGDGVTNRTIKASPLNDPFERYPLVKTILPSTEVWEGGSVESPSFLYHDGYLYMYYNGQNPQRERAIGVAYYKLGV